jgi:hypothetical protein
MSFADEDHLLVPSCFNYAIRLPKGSIDKMTEKKKKFTKRMAGWKTFKRIGESHVDKSAGGAQMPEPEVMFRGAYGDDAGPAKAKVTASSTASTTKTTSNVVPAGSWGSTFGCFDDLLGCMYVSCCSPCALCEIGNAMGDHPVGPKKEPASTFMGCCSQFQNALSYDQCGCCLAACICPDKCCFMYQKNILEAYANYAGKQAPSPGPCGDPLCQVLFFQPCTYCLIYRELGLTPCGSAPNGNKMARV